jgi:hypothetical protein
MGAALSYGEKDMRPAKFSKFDFSSRLTIMF